MLLTKTVMVKWNGNNRKHYEEKGYEFTKINDVFEVKVEDLINGSHVMVDVMCDCETCSNPYLKPMEWRIYLRSKRDNDEYYCSKCCQKMYGTTTMKKTKLSKSISFEKWCYNNLSKEEAVEILSRWDYEKNIDINGNTIKPNEISYRSDGFNRKGYWFKCNKHFEHESELKSICNFTEGQNGSILCNQCNSFAQYLLDTYGENGIQDYWSEENTINPWEIPKSKNKLKIKIKCQNNTEHENYVTTCNSFSRINGARCPECSRERDESILQEKVRLYLEETNYTILHERDCTIIAQNPKIKNKKGRLPYDNEVIINNKHLIIEVHGIQHYKITNYAVMSAKKHYTTPKQELNYQQLKDRYKRIFAKSRGFFFLEIPYWTEKDESYKDLIDNKLEEILSNKKQ